MAYTIARNSTSNDTRPMALIPVTARISIDERDLEWQFIRASGPGGQNVNKVATAVQLRFNATTLPGDVFHRLRTLAGRRLTDDGMLIIDARQHRTQERNRDDALQRLLDLLRRACEKPKPRVKTKPTRASRERRLESKRKTSGLKRGRGKSGLHD